MRFVPDLSTKKNILKFLLSLLFFLFSLLFAIVRMRSVSPLKEGLTESPIIQVSTREKLLKTSRENQPGILETSEYLLYLPPRMDTNLKHPMVVALSPSADAWSMIHAWEKAVGKHQWILFASKFTSNNRTFGENLNELVPLLRSLPEDYPIDREKIIATGLSGGAMLAHFLAYQHPKLIAAVVANTGMMDDHPPELPYPRNKVAVFLASSTDFRYGDMKKNLEFLKGLGWKTRWIEFPGGHKLAPSAVYEEAADWVAQHLEGR